MNQKGFSNIAFIILLIVFAGTVGYFTFVKKSGSVIQTPSSVVTDTSNNQSPSTLQNATANWKTYSSSKFFYSLKIPPAASIFERQDFYFMPFTGLAGDVILGEGFDEYGLRANEVGESLGYEIQLHIEDNPSFLSPKEFAEKKISEAGGLPLTPFHAEEISISGYPAYLLDSDNGSLLRQVVLGRGNLVYYLSLSVETPRKNRSYFDPHIDIHNEIFKNVLLNFRFLDEESGTIIVPPEKGKIIYPRLPELD